MNETFKYDDKIVRNFLLAMLIWAGVAFLVGIWAALQLAYHPFNTTLPWFTFGRLRPLHTNAAIFAFAGNAIFAGIYHSTQRLLKTRMASDFFSKIHFWGWQLIIVAAAITLPLGLSVAKEYAELEWPVDLMITIVWVIFGANLFWTIGKRREQHIYVAIWFYIATVVTVALLHVVNSIAIPVSLFKSYSVYAGVQDALVQWWYGHNAVAFFLTTPFLGLMYYYIPKAAQRPVYSYKLSLIHFWTLVFIYIWAGPHHLLYTALPEWAQTLGMVFSVMLWIPSWGGMINGLLTLRGAWDKLRSDPVIRFMATATIFYGMSTFEGPMLSIKSVSGLAHYTDWIIAHVHAGALGWNGFMAFGMAYYLVPRLWKTELHSKSLANVHFWIGTLGIMIYALSMWASGITQGLMWKAIDPTTGRLLYPDFVETVLRIVPLYWIRAVGGILYFVGYCVMMYNLVKTIANAPGAVEDTQAQGSRWVESPAAHSSGIHRKLEGMPGVFAVLAFFAILVGSVIQIVPMLSATDLREQEAQATGIHAKIRPYTPLELAGRDVYVREGCYVCHSQMIRPMVSEKLRYGDPSRAEESIYDHPFQWGSKRTGPDLARIGQKYPDLWHYRHMRNPREVVPQSIMPTYGWLLKDKTNFAILSKKLSVMKMLGVPYTDEEIANAPDLAMKQALEITARLREQGAPQADERMEIVSLIAYLQSLGQLQIKAGGK